MKKWILPLLAALLTTVSCGILGESREEKVARQAREARMVDDNVRGGDFVIDIDRMIPLRGVSQHISTYSVRVKDGVLTSHLPFIGQAWRVPFGGGHALNFTAEIGSYTVVPLEKEGYQVRIYVKTDEDEHLYLLYIYPNGRASLDVHSGNRDRISYTGVMDFYSE